MVRLKLTHTPDQCFKYFFSSEIDVKARSRILYSRYRRTPALARIHRHGKKLDLCWRFVAFRLILLILLMLSIYTTFYNICIKELDISIHLEYTIAHCNTFRLFWLTVNERNCNNKNYVIQFQS